MATFTTDGELKVLSTLFKTVGCELCLATNADLTELTDGSYARGDLSAVMGDVVDGAIQNTSEIAFDTGEQTAAWWFVADEEGDPICFGPLPSPQSGEFRFQPGAIRFEAISG